MEFYTATVYNKIEGWKDYIVVCAANAFCAEQEAINTLVEMGRNSFEWKVIDLEIWD